MGIIYREMVRYRKDSFIRGLSLLVLFILVINLLVNSGHYSDRFNIAVESLIFIGAMAATVMVKLFFDIAYTHKICYMYKVIDKDLIFERILGSSSKAILSMDMKHAELLAPASDVKDLKDIDRVYKFLCSPKKKNIYCCVVNDGGIKIKVCFQPSDELVKKLMMIMENNKRVSKIA